MTVDRLFQVQRHERLLTQLRSCGAVRVRELARDLGVSELTIRRDIAALAARNLVTRVHGGATLPATSPRRPRPAPAAGFPIGMVVPSLDFYWPPIVAGARAAAAALGVTIQLRGSSYDPDEDRRQIGRLVEEQQVRGLLLAPNLDGPGADEMLDWIGGLPVPAVLVERQPRRWSPAARRIEWVRSDHTLGMEMAVHHLREQGHDRIGLMLSGGSPTSAYLRKGGNGIDDLLVPGEPEAAVRACRAGVTALIVHSDPDAIAVVSACHEAGLDVPGDLAVVAYDDEIAHLAQPALTAVRPPKHHVGRVAVELMVARLQSGDRRPPQGVLLTPELLVRESSLLFRKVRV
ncbi:substrate-binding domain-containing protein [Actinoplanes sp. NPDC051851]|uniref:substrate-binding domain-containing protein n=1 Tax=Actinoplanes sp. NPDC051851 TaxID=3154753 RepID=UPI00344A95ED